MRVKFLIFAVSMLTTVIPQYVLAQEKYHERHFYITAKPGIYSPQASDLENFGTGFNGEIAVGWLPSKYFALEVGGGYFNTDGGSVPVVGTLGLRVNTDLDVIPLTLTLKGIIPYKKFEFFGLGGVGAYFVSVDGKLNFSRTSIKVKDDDVVFGGYLGLGMHYNITPWIFVGAEAKYLWTDKAKFKDQVFISGPLVEVEAKSKLDGILATAVLGIRF